MQIPPPALKATLASPNPRAPDWQAGQRLEAQVVRGGAAGEQTRVRIGDQELSLRLPAAMPPGSRLSLEVVRMGTQPLLRLLSQTPFVQPSTGQAGIGPGTGAPTALTSLLPAQGSQAPLLAALWALSRDPGATAALPGSVQAALKDLFGRLHTATQATRPKGLREAVLASGIFHEAALALGQGGAATAAGDLKSALLSLATQLRAQRRPGGQGNAAGQRRPGPGAASADTGPAHRLPATATSTATSSARAMPQAVAFPTWIIGSAREAAPPRAGSTPSPQARLTTDLSTPGRQALLDGLRTSTDQALARLAMHQWSAVENAESGQLRWLLELPLRSGDGVDLLHLLMERERKRSAPDQAPVWRAEMALDLPGLGPVHVRIAVSGDQVGTRLWVGDENTAARVRRELPKLREALEGRQLKVRDLGCTPGEPPEQQHPVRTRPVLDDRA
ncbi:flagellar hook-length control protein FliK [Thioalkalivibrio sp.]|uniref:flagellar hook-length control protein FliK n=1 Tax=Thioalkalivibrio sp. TaxID=2093813 RepID=UPI0012D5BD2C|nr:flagellar hook-length control protein FliK [Thioalkalivibrio sp.]TVP81620.1 MAG: flagellar hook-length control protein FliK [Thioalkalivibrio sp.]